MTQPEIRRASDPRIVRKLHNAIKKTCEQKQSPVLDRVYRAITSDKIQITRSRVEMQLKNSVRDGLILESNSGSTRKPGDIKMSYRVPTLENFYEIYEDDEHDWYCWVCHREGEVYLCTRCPRVIHKKCAELSDEDLQDDFVCYCCKDLESTKQYGKKELQELATMLGYTVQRMKSKCEELWFSATESEEPTYKLFIYNDTNLNDLERRVRMKEFDSLAKFHYEIEWLFHNAVIFYGGENKITNLARMVVLDGQNELSQIDICSECYIRSNDRAKNWFSNPCKPPHRIVYAKLGNDPPWPAKVLRENEDCTSVDVRFFGPPYQRAWIPIRNIWEMNERPVMKKRSKALAQAEEELKIYLRLLADQRKNTKNKRPSSDADTVTEEEIDDMEEEEEEEIEDSSSRNIKSENENDEDYNKDMDDKVPGKFQPPVRKKRRKKIGNAKHVKENFDVKKNDSKKPHNNQRKSKNQKASERFRELQEARLMEITKRKDDGEGNTKDQKVDINQNLDKEDDNDNEDLQLAKQIKMTDDYKMIEKLQDRIRQLEKLLAQVKKEYELSQTELESVHNELARERQITKSLREEVEKSNEIDVEKIKNEMLLKKQDEIELAVEEERKRNEMEFEVRLNEAIGEERVNSETKLQEALEKERATLDGKVKIMTQREREEMQHNLDRYKADYNRTMEERVRKVKIDSDEMAKIALQENIRRVQLDSERIVAAAKKKSWCSNCTKEAFYHCCWNTNYCSTECQRVNWVTHRYQCTREMMSTCRSCQQRQNFPGNFAASPQVPPK